MVGTSGVDLGGAMRESSSLLWLGGISTASTYAGSSNQIGRGRLADRQNYSSQLTQLLPANTLAFDSDLYEQHAGPAASPSSLIISLFAGRDLEEVER